MSSTTATSTITLHASAAYGYERKQYIAQISGRAAKVTFARSFVGRRWGKRDEETTYDTDEVGLYEVCSVDRKGNKAQRYWLVLPATNVAAAEAVAEDAEEEGRVDEGAALRAAAGELVRVEATKEEAMAIAKLMDKGEALEEVVRVVNLRTDEIEILTPAQARKAAAAASVDSAVDACLAVLAALPEREGKRVLAELRKRLSPPAAATTTTHAASEVSQ